MLWQMNGKTPIEKIVEYKEVAYVFFEKKKERR